MEPTTTRNGSPSKSGLPDGWENWPDATGVAKRLRCSRSHVYRLEQKGDLRGVDGYVMGRRRRRFDPELVAALAPPEDELAGFDDELDDDDDDRTPDAQRDAMRMLARLLTEARQITTDARKGQHEAYQLVAVPSRELQNITLEALTKAYARIRELEEQLNRMHDEQRDARRDDREFALFEKAHADGEARKDAVFRVFVDNAPTLLGQVLETLKAGKGPLAEWMRSKTPEQQQKLIMAIEAVMAVEDEAAASSSSSPEKGSSDGSGT